MPSLAVAEPLVHDVLVGWPVTFVCRLYYVHHLVHWLFNGIFVAADNNEFRCQLFVYSGCFGSFLYFGFCHYFYLFIRT